MTTIHKNSYKTNKKPPQTPPNTLKVFHVYIGRPQKKKKCKILTQGKSCFFIVNATSYDYVGRITQTLLINPTLTMIKIKFIILG